MLAAIIPVRDFYFFLVSSQFWHQPVMPAQHSHSWEAYGVSTSPKISRRRRHRRRLPLLLIPNDSLGSHFIFCIQKKAKRKSQCAHKNKREKGKKIQRLRRDGRVGYVSSSFLLLRVAHLIVRADGGAKDAHMHASKKKAYKTYIQTK